MIYKISAIKLSVPNSKNFEHITNVYIQELGWQTVAQVALWIIQGHQFKSANAPYPKVEKVYKNGRYFIKTDANAFTTDNLLSLPKY